MQGLRLRNREHLGKHSVATALLAEIEHQRCQTRTAELNVGAVLQDRIPRPYLFGVSVGSKKRV